MIIDKISKHQAVSKIALVGFDALGKAIIFSLSVSEKTNIAAVSVKNDFARSFVSA